MVMKQVSIFLENSPGHMRKVCKILAEGGVNLRTVTIAETQNFGVLRAIVDDSDRASEVLRSAGVMFKEVEVIGMSVEDKAGSLLGILDRLEAEGLNVEYMYSMPNGEGDTFMVMKFADIERAKEVLVEADKKVK